MKTTKTGLSFVLLILLGFVWGSGYSLAKYAMTHDVPALSYAFWQSAGPALLLSSACVINKKIAWLRLKYWPYYLVCGLLGIAIPNTNMYVIASHIPAGLLAVLVNTVPLIVYPLALFIGQERFDVWRVIAIITGMAGILLMTMPHVTGVLSWWVLLTLISPLGFALCSIYIKASQPATINALEAASGMLIAATCLLTPWVFYHHTFYSLLAPFDTTKQVIVLEILLSSLGYLLFFTLIRLAGSVFYSLTGGVVSLTGLFWGYIIFSESPDTIECLAIICICLALFLLSWRQSRQPGY